MIVPYPSTGPYLSLHFCALLFPLFYIDLANLFYIFNLYSVELLLLLYL